MILEIVSPEALLFSGEVTSISLPGVDGSFQILNNHAPIVSILKQGTVKIAATSFKFEKDLIVCFNINQIGFNVFPNKKDVENFVFKKTVYRKMGMSILSSGGASNIEESLVYIKKLPLDYVVYGSSKMMNIQINYNLLK